VNVLAHCLHRSSGGPCARWWRWLLLAASVAMVSLGTTRGVEAETQLPELGPAEGFGAAATGGAGGAEYVVTSLADSGPGTLREGAGRPERLRIRFGLSGEIRLRTGLPVEGNKTIDGRGASVRLTGKGLALERPNVIVENLLFGPFDKTQRLDALALHGRQARDIWIDHCSFSGAPDKAIEMSGGATDVTVSWSRFSQQEQVIQAGAFETGEADLDIRLTVHHNFFDRTGYRNPRISYGKAHAFNNVLREWEEHGMSARRGGQLASESNVFEAGRDRSAIELAGGKDDKDETPGLARSTGDLLLNGSEAKTLDADRVFNPSSFYLAKVEPADQNLLRRVVDGAGWKRTAGLGLEEGQGTGTPQPSSSRELVVVAAGAGALAVFVVTGLVLSRRRRQGSA
jgi:pectate lyase